MNMRRVPENRIWPDQVFFVTISTLGRNRLFMKPENASCVLESLRFFRHRNEIELFAFVVMPDHVHVILRPILPLTLSAWLRRFKSYTTHKLGPGPIWQTGCWSEVLEGTRVPEKLKYIHENPVHARLCESSEEYLWSSAREYFSGAYDVITPS